MTVTVGQGRRPNVRRPWPRLPRWFWVLVAVTVAAFGGFVGDAVNRVVGFEEQPLFERRPPPAPGQSHAVGRVEFSRADPVPVRCGAISGLRVAGDDVVRPLLAESIERGVCGRLGGLDPRLADRIAAAARKGTIVSFGVFEGTGVDSTTLAGPPPRIVVNTRYAGAFKGYLLQVLAHELWHGGSTEVTAEEEYLARVVEDAMCRLQPEIASVRGCEEARSIVELGEAEAVRRLREAGYR